MKIFHLSDLHIGLKLMNRDLREDQEYIFRQIVDRVKAVSYTHLLVSKEALW